MISAESALEAFGGQLAELGWVRALLVAGSLATGDHVPGVSDLDLVALVDGPVDGARTGVLTALHRRLDSSAARGLDLGCAYVGAALVPDLVALHPTWTHGAMVRRALSGITRAELVLCGYAVFGPPPTDGFPPVDEDDVRRAARAELLGYWAGAARRPWVWLDPVLADLGLTSMARARHALATGRLLSKTLAAEQAAAPARLRDELGARRRGEPVTSPRLRTAMIAWRDARTTVLLARDGAQGRR